MVIVNMYIQIFSLDLLYMYLIGDVRYNDDESAFRALTQGYNGWALGRLDQLKINM